MDDIIDYAWQGYWAYTAFRSLARIPRTQKFPLFLGMGWLQYKWVIRLEEVRDVFC